MSEPEAQAKDTQTPFWKKRSVQLLVGLPLAVYFIYKLIYPTSVWNEKMTVTISTPDGDKTGSAVRRVKIVRNPRLLPQITGAQITLKGEAVVVDLGNDKYLFALLGAPAGWAASAYRRVFPDDKQWHRRRGSWASSLRGRGILDIPRNGYPRLVTFGDINDPTSVKKLDPEDLDAAFGCETSTEETPWRDEKLSWRDWQKMKAAGVTPKVYRQYKDSPNRHRKDSPSGDQKRVIKTTNPIRDNPNACYRIKSLTLEITNEPVTQDKVEEVLGWLDTVWPNRLDGKRFETINAGNRFANSLSTGNFTTESFK